MFVETEGFSASISRPFPLPGLIAPPKLPAHTMPLALLKGVRIAPSTIFLNEGNFFSTRAILGDQIVSQGFDITYRD